MIRQPFKKNIESYSETMQANIIQKMEQNMLESSSLDDLSLPLRHATDHTINISNIATQYSVEHNATRWSTSH